MSRNYTEESDPLALKLFGQALCAFLRKLALASCSSPLSRSRSMVSLSVSFMTLQRAVQSHVVSQSAAERQGSTEKKTSSSGMDSWHILRLTGMVANTTGSSSHAFLFRKHLLRIQQGGMREEITLPAQKDPHLELRRKWEKLPWIWPFRTSSWLLFKLERVRNGELQRQSAEARL